MHRLLTPFALAGVLTGQAPPAVPSAHETQAQALRWAGADRAGRVHHACDAAQVPWALGDAWKASFGAEGFTYVPFFGADAPRNFPLTLRLREVTVGGADLPFATGVVAGRIGDRMTYDRGVVQEVYDLAADRIEQTFVVDGSRAGDVDVVLDVHGELVEDPSLPGLQFGNELGRVEYGAAFLVRGGDRLPLETSYHGGAIRIHVPAGLRGPGPIVIDPVVRTDLNSGRPVQGNDTEPDVAYDAGAITFLLVWATRFSQTDTDVWMELLHDLGGPISGTVRAIDLSSVSHRAPRVANVNSADRFLVVMERQQGMGPEVVGRFVPTSTWLPGAEFPISVADGGYHGSPDVGGDPRPQAGGAFCVTWIGLVNGSTEIRARVVRPDGTLLPPATIASGGNHSAVDIARSNDCGSHAPRWFLAWSEVVAPQRADLRVAAVAPDGTVPVSASTLTAGGAYLYPSVASPVLGGDGQPEWLVTAELQSPARAVAFVVPHDLATIRSEDLTSRHGLGTFRVRAESDGVRHAVVSGSLVNGLPLVTAATLFVGPRDSTLHDWPSPLPGSMAFPRLCSKASAGGTTTADYVVVGTSQSSTPHRIAIARYLGHGAGSLFARRYDTDCSDLDLDRSGAPFLGSELRFQLYGSGRDLPGLLVGLQRNPSSPLCGSCRVGVDLGGPLVNYVLTTAASFRVPRQVELLGAALACQGYAFGTGCGPGVRVSETQDFWVR